MKNLLLTLFLVAFTCLMTFAQGIEFFHGTWEEAIAKAKAEDRLIFVDAFTTWCGPCKSMSANVFPNEEVGAFFNQHFVSLKIDMEKEMGTKFKSSFPVTAYPTLFFIDSDNKVVQKAVGAKTVPDFIKLGESVIAKYDKSTKFEAAYNAGDRSYQLVYNYVAALNKAGKPSTKIANDYLTGQTDLTTEENLKFILEAASQVDCQCFELFEKYKSQIQKITSADLVDDKVRQAVSNTIKRAIEFESPDLIALAYNAMKKHIPSEAEYVRSKGELEYALATNDLANIETVVNNHVKKHVKDDAEGLHQLALDLNKYGADNPACRRLAIELAAKASKDKDPKFVSTYAQLVFKAGQKQEAINILDEAIRKYGSEEDNKDLQTLKALKMKIENS